MFSFFEKNRRKSCKILIIVVKLILIRNYIRAILECLDFCCRNFVEIA